MLVPPCGSGEPTGKEFSIDEAEVGFVSGPIEILCIRANPMIIQRGSFVT